MVIYFSCPVSFACLLDSSLSSLFTKSFLRISSTMQSQIFKSKSLNFSFVIKFLNTDNLSAKVNVTFSPSSLLSLICWSARSMSPVLMSKAVLNPLFWSSSTNLTVLVSCKFMVVDLMQSKTIFLIYPNLSFLGWCLRTPCTLLLFVVLPVFLGYLPSPHDMVMHLP